VLGPESDRNPDFWDRLRPRTPPLCSEDSELDADGQREGAGMKRTPINPWSWFDRLGFDQAELVEDHKRLLVCSGQDAVNTEGAPQHHGDMAAQIELALDNLEAVLAAAGMSLANVVRLNAFTTDIDRLFEHWSAIKDRMGSADGRFATSVLGVARLPAQLLVMFEATAVD